MNTMTRITLGAAALLMPLVAVAAPAEAGKGYKCHVLSETTTSHVNRDGTTTYVDTITERCKGQIVTVKWTYATVAV